VTCRYKVPFNHLGCGHPIVLLPTKDWLAYFEKKGGGVCGDCPLIEMYDVFQEGAMASQDSKD
jgi:hypothetical protein